jgi:hypothetical protein
MPITFDCTCGTTLSVRDEPPVYFVRCPKCQETNKVPHPKKRRKQDEPVEEDPGFIVIDETRPRSTAFDKPKKNEEEAAWEAAPYEPPSVKPAYQVGEKEVVQRGETKGTGEAEPYEITQEEFEEEEQERLKRRKGRKVWRALWLIGVTVFALAAFLAAGQITRLAKDATSPRAIVGAARIGIFFTWLITLLVIWLANWGSEYDE